MEESTLLRVVYISTVVAPFNEDELRRLVEKASKANAAIDITGMLCYNAGDFLQILEGPPAAVEELLEIISRDPRHLMVQILHRGSCTTRLFPDWAMELCDSRFEVSICRSEFSTIASFLSHCENLDANAVALGLLNHFRKLSRGNAA